MEVGPEWFPETVVGIGEGKRFTGQGVASAFIPCDHRVSGIHYRHTYTVSAALLWGFGGASRSGGQFMRGLVMDRETTRWDSLSRKAGYGLRQGTVAGARRLVGSRRENIVRAR